jgi:1-deoxyxylulose-5-phosphate synthase
MEYTKLGNTGMDVSRICLGCMGFGDAERWIHKWVLNEENSRPIIKKAIELGINSSIPPMSILLETVRRFSVAL